MNSSYDVQSAKDHPDFVDDSMAHLNCHPKGRYSSMAPGSGQRQRQRQRQGVGQAQ